MFEMVVLLALALLLSLGCIRAPQPNKSNMIVGKVSAVLIMSASQFPLPNKS